MTTLAQICMGIHIREGRWSSSGDEWHLIVNSAGADVLNKTVSYTHLGAGTGQIVTVGPDARQFPPGGFARVYIFGERVLTGTPLFSDQVSAQFAVETALLEASSLRFGIHGRDLIRPRHVLLWGYDAAMAVVPLALDVDLSAEVSEDESEGPSSIALTLVDSGSDSTPLNEVMLYVELTSDRNAGTHQPASFSVEDADGAILFQSDLEDFQQLEPDTRSGVTWSDGADSRNAMIWRLADTSPAFSRVDSQGRPVVVKLSVTGADDAMIQAVVAFGVNRSGARPAVVPLVHHFPALANTNPWLGTHHSPAGRDMVLPLCPAASRQ